jgi:hypothetical protein
MQESADQRKVWDGVSVCFDSIGGDLAAALELGAVIRESRFDTCMSADYEHEGADGMTRLSDGAFCVGSCVLALAAGVHREIDEDARVGVFPFTSEVFGRVDEAQIAAVLARYVERMGVKQELLDRAALASPMYYLKHEESQALLLDNLTPPEQQWQLYAAPGKAAPYAYSVVRNMRYDNETAVYVTKARGHTWLKVEFAPAARWAPGRHDSDVASIADLPDALGKLTVKLDEFSLDFGTAPWRAGPNNTFWKAVALSNTAQVALSNANTLDVYVDMGESIWVVHRYRHLDPHASFSLAGLKPLLPRFRCDYGVGC